MEVLIPSGRSGVCRRSADLVRWSPLVWLDSPQKKKRKKLLLYRINFLEEDTIKCLCNRVLKLKVIQGTYLDVNNSFPGCFCFVGYFLIPPLDIWIASKRTQIWLKTHQIQDFRGKSCISRGFSKIWNRFEAIKMARGGIKKYPTRQKHPGNESFTSR